MYNTPIDPFTGMQFTDYANPFTGGERTFHTRTFEIYSKDGYKYCVIKRGSLLYRAVPKGTDPLKPMLCKETHKIGCYFSLDDPFLSESMAIEYEQPLDMYTFIVKEPISCADAKDYKIPGLNWLDCNHLDLAQGALVMARIKDSEVAEVFLIPEEFGKLKRIGSKVIDPSEIRNRYWPYLNKGWVLPRDKPLDTGSMGGDVYHKNPYMTKEDFIKFKTTAADAFEEEEEEPSLFFEKPKWSEVTQAVADQLEEEFKEVWSKYFNADDFERMRTGDDITDYSIANTLETKQLDL